VPRIEADGPHGLTVSLDDWTTLKTETDGQTMSPESPTAPRTEAADPTTRTDAEISEAWGQPKNWALFHINKFCTPLMYTNIFYNRKLIVY
jgi:hypothetical protein